MLNRWLENETKEELIPAGYRPRGCEESPGKLWASHRCWLLLRLKDTDSGN